MVRELNNPKVLPSCLQVQRDECTLLLFDVMVEDGRRITRDQQVTSVTMMAHREAGLGRPLCRSNKYVHLSADKLPLLCDSSFIPKCVVTLAAKRLNTNPAAKDIALSMTLGT